MCTAWSTWQYLNNQKRDAMTVRKELTKARVHLDFVVSLYHEQIEGGRLFIHDHPLHATSWMEKSIQSSMDVPGVVRTHGD